MTDSIPVAAEPAPDRELATSRIIDAPRERVFRAFSDPAQLARWWGPRGFTNTFHEFDLRPGGKWRFIMHGPDGRDYPNESVFVEVVAPASFVFDHVCPPHFRLTIALADQDGGTRIDWRQRFNSAGECARVAKICVAANEQNLDRLEAVVAGRTPQ